MGKKIWVMTFVFTLIFSISAYGDDSGFKENLDTPTITFVNDNSARTLTVTSVDPSDILWSDIEINGTCDLSSLGVHVMAGDVIGSCFGSISVTYGPTGSVIGIWDFPDLSSPYISCVKDSSGRTLTVTSADPSDILWSDIDIDGDCDVSSLGKYVISGDMIRSCYGTISLTYGPTGSIIGIWEFSDKFSYQNETPSLSYTISYIDLSLTITSIDSGYHYGGSSSNIDANLVFVKNGVSYYVINDYYSGLAISNSGFVATQIISAGDVISGFSSGTYSIVWKPTNDVIGVINFPEEETPSIEYGWIYGKVLLESEGVTYPGKNLSVYIYSNNMYLSSNDAALIDQKGNYYSTNDTGQYMISNLESGTYSIQAIKNKLYKSSQEFVRVSGNEGTEVNFIIEISKTRLEVEKNIKSGNIGGEINIKYEKEGKFGHDSVTYSNVVISDIQVDSEEISIIVSGDELSLGKTIAVTTDLALFDISQDFIVKYDGEIIRMADDIDDVLNPNDDGIHAEYLITVGTESIEILVSVPHFSEHEITITSFQPEGPIEEIVESVGGINALILYITISALVSMFFIGSIYIRRRF